ncbi:hypothetical protein A2U01_0007561, partial [Trifolium medium]|nr:hypothetical protein [Trifolium medium]
IKMLNKLELAPCNLFKLQMKLSLKVRIFEMRDTQFVAIKMVSKIYNQAAYQRVHMCTLDLDTSNNQLEVIECKCHMVVAMDIQEATWTSTLNEIVIVDVSNNFVPRELNSTSVHSSSNTLFTTLMKMINRGNVRHAKVLIKWKALPLKHGICDCPSLRIRMFEGEDIVIGIKAQILRRLSPWTVEQGPIAEQPMKIQLKSTF